MLSDTCRVRRTPWARAPPRGAVVAVLLLPRQVAAVPKDCANGSRLEKFEEQGRSILSYQLRGSHVHVSRIHPTPLGNQLHRPWLGQGRCVLVATDRLNQASAPVFPVALSLRPHCGHPECRLGLVSLLERLPTWHDAVGHVYIGGSGVNGAGGVSANAIDVVLFLRARDPAHVDDAREAAVAALRRRSGVTFDVAVAPRGA